MSTEADFRLPRSVVPRHYSITIEPDLENFVFSGSEIVEVDVQEPVSQVILNSLDLVIDTCELVQLASGRRIATDVVYDRDAERVNLELGEVAEPGPWQLHMSFRGVLNDELHGFYRSSYTDDSGQEKFLATTQFESTHARQAVPCWDEPDLKATFGVTLVVPDGLMAISNQPEKAREQHGDGTVAVTFRDTMVMPVYLLTFIVGDLEASEPVDVDGIPLRIVHQPGRGNLTSFATEAAVHGLQYLADNYGIAYPGDKLDMIAIPDFAWGAMENLGAITYRESDLLVDPGRATNAEIERVAAVVSHELAHMWFGDLVTMRWWDGVWLNEAFATFMEVKCTDHLRPEWNAWLYFGADRSAAMEIDALTTTRPVEFPVASPQEANAMFDVLTYEKGSAVLRMLEQYLGEDIFRDGVRHYLRTHAYSNTVTDDLWRSLEEVSGEPIGEIMHSWIYQGGLPDVQVTSKKRGFQLSQEQFRYLLPGEGSWSIPLLYRTDAGEGRLLLRDPVDIEGEGRFVANAGGHGFYRVRYDPELLAAFTSDMSVLKPAERYSLVKDVWASVLRVRHPGRRLRRACLDARGRARADGVERGLACSQRRFVTSRLPATGRGLSNSSATWRPLRPPTSAGEGVQVRPTGSGSGEVTCFEPWASWVPMTPRSPRQGHGSTGRNPTARSTPMSPRPHSPSWQRTGPSPTSSISPIGLATLAYPRNPTDFVGRWPRSRPTALRRRRSR